MSESNFQTKVVKYLRAKKCFVLVTTPHPGIPDGCPDVIALFNGGGWAALELKKGPNEKYQPLQKPTIKKLDEMYYSRAVWPENWELVKEDLSRLI